jgi:hypothetical protein
MSGAIFIKLGRAPQTFTIFIEPIPLDPFAISRRGTTRHRIIRAPPDYRAKPTPNRITPPSLGTAAFRRPSSNLVKRASVVKFGLFTPPLQDGALLSVGIGRH